MQLSMQDLNTRTVQVAGVWSGGRRLNLNSYGHKRDKRYALHCDCATHIISLFGLRLQATKDYELALMFAFVCSDAIAPNARMVVLRTTRIAHTRITISSQHASHACLSRSLSRVVIYFWIRNVSSVTPDKLHLSLPIADRRYARLTPHARILPPENSSAQREGTRDCWKSDTREGPHHGSLSRRDSLPSLRALPSFFAKPFFRSSSALSLMAFRVASSSRT